MSVICVPLCVCVCVHAFFVCCCLFAPFCSVCACLHVGGRDSLPEVLEQRVGNCRPLHASCESRAQLSTSALRSRALRSDQLRTSFMAWRTRRSSCSAFVQSLVTVSNCQVQVVFAAACSHRFSSNLLSYKRDLMTHRCQI